MDSLERLKRWQARATRERAPEPDVVADVMRRIRAGRQRQAGAYDFLPWVLSGAMASAAAVCAILGGTAWLTISDPMAGWASRFSDWVVL